ncbi:aldehyde dehydrogenase family protein [Streptomyces botrytidirepellens]|uniref:Aldehyde dehydrogenase family protein n=1 Tax=Streptomyces botrytidirepellens TaxID=2486417 RepID=A0A3M8VY10_9ACTN|nr:aldehyde dehydrogenase family protein [Streptomyces botrytidirepellens]RNG22210.1 aldehyde dehydrogenase family protein [Streptomyces botrytidirepellens]
MSTTITTVNPATGTEIASYAAHDADQVEAAVAATHSAATSWAATPLDHRLSRLTTLAETLRERADEYAALITQEMGKPLTEAVGEIEKSAVTAEYYASEAERILADEPVEVDGARAWIGYEPLGVIYAVMPWNFPFWQVMRFAIPTLAAGNAVLLKHSPNVTGSALAIERLLVRAGFPAHLLTTLVVPEQDVPSTSEQLIADPRIAAVTLTGSNRAGAAVGAAAGRAVKKAVLELGGSDAFVVLADADLEAASTAAVAARFTNSGQSCVCAKRFLVAEPVAAEFTRLFVEKTRALVVGDPTDPATRIGPLAREDLRNQLHTQVEKSIGQGATLLVGGQPVEGPGTWYEPTVLSGTGPGVTAFDEETFGPVAAIATAADDDGLIALADASAYGLGLSIWSTDTDRAISIARRITSGAAFVNAVVASDPRLPFGGTKKSGHGRELATAGIREFTTIRTYWVAG